MKTWALALLTLVLTAGAHQYSFEYDEWKKFPCPVFDELEHQYERKIMLYDWFDWGDPKEVEAIRHRLETLRDIKAHVCLEV